MRLIDPVIRRSLSEAVEGAGGLLAFSRRIGVAHSTVLFWLTGKTKRINSDLWRGRVYSEIESYLAANLPELDPAAVRERYSDCLDVGYMERRMNFVSVVHERELLNYDPVMESVCVFAEKYSFAKEAFLCDGRKKYFALQMENSDLRFFYPGTVVLLCAADVRVKDGDFAVLRMRGGEYLRICRVFFRDECVCLEALSGEEGAEWNFRSERGRVEWMFPVLWIRGVCRKNGASVKKMEKNHIST